MVMATKIQFWRVWIVEFEVSRIKFQKLQQIFGIPIITVVEQLRSVSFKIQVNFS